jgi:hypothetical protein
MLFVADSKNILYGASEGSVIAYQTLVNGSIVPLWNTSVASGLAPLATAMGLIEGSVLYVTVINIFSGSPTGNKNILLRSHWIFVVEMY